jgi:hypothetical protein
VLREEAIRGTLSLSVSFQRRVAAMTAQEAISAARAEVQSRGGTLDPVIRAWRRRRWILFGRRYWTVWSNSDCVGCNWWVELDDEAGTILRAAFLTR